MKIFFPACCGLRLSIYVNPMSSSPASAALCDIVVFCLFVDDFCMTISPVSPQLINLFTAFTYHGAPNEPFMIFVKTLDCITISKLLVLILCLRLFL